jgi:hypothetical protein
VIVVIIERKSMLHRGGLGVTEILAPTRQRAAGRLAFECCSAISRPRHFKTLGPLVTDWFGPQESDSH